jgi:hypothetical protein
MNSTVFTELGFWLLVLFSIAIPCALYAALLATRSVAKPTVLLFGLALVAIAGVDVYLLQVLSASAKLSPSLADDAVFSSELTVAFYLLPALFAGIGINVVSHVMVQHLVQAESTYEREHPEP